MHGFHSVRARDLVGGEAEGLMGLNSRTSDS
jgi:hypothetical protein